MVIANIDIFELALANSPGGNCSRRRRHVFGGVQMMGEGSRCSGERRSGRISFAVGTGRKRQGIKGSTDGRVEAAVAVAVFVIVGGHGKQVDGWSRIPLDQQTTFSLRIR